jgi:hypothetical protein
MLTGTGEAWNNQIICLQVEHLGETTTLVLYTVTQGRAKD